MMLRYLYLLLLFPAMMLAQTRPGSLMVNSNGVITAPTNNNFFVANSNLLNVAIGPVVSTIDTNALTATNAVNQPTRIASATYTDAATNDLYSTLMASINAKLNTNDLPAITNGFVTWVTTNFFATTNLAASLAQDAAVSYSLPLVLSNAYYQAGILASNLSLTKADTNADINIFTGNLPGTNINWNPQAMPGTNLVAELVPYRTNNGVIYYFPGMTNQP